MLPVLLLLGAAAVVVDELVLWAGQPTGDPSSATVAGWYGDHAGRVLAGDAVWVLACLPLAAGYVRIGRTLAGRRQRLLVVTGSSPSSPCSPPGFAGRRLTSCPADCGGDRAPGGRAQCPDGSGVLASAIVRSSASASASGPASAR